MKPIAILKTEKTFIGILIFVVIAVAAWKRFSLPLVPLCDGDVWCYLNPGLSLLVDGRFQHSYGQCFLYPGFIYTILVSTHHFDWITAVQHLLGLAAGLLLYFCWWRLAVFYPKRPQTLLYSLFGVLLITAYLLSTTSIRFEQDIRPEAIFPFFTILHIALTLEFIYRWFFKFTSKANTPDFFTICIGVGSVVTAFISFFIKPSFVLALPFGLLPVAIAIFFGKGLWIQRGMLVGISFVLIVGCLFWPESYFRQSDLYSKTFLPESLLSIHADLIRDQIQDDIKNHAITPYSESLLSSVAFQLNQEIQKSATPACSYPSLGFNPDTFKDNSFFGWFEKCMLEQLKDQSKANEYVVSFCQFYYRHLLCSHPLWMLGKIERQLKVFYNSQNCPAYSMYRNYSLNKEYRWISKVIDGENKSNIKINLVSKIFAYPVETNIVAPGALTLSTTLLSQVFLKDFLFSYYDRPVSYRVNNSFVWWKSNLEKVKAYPPGKIYISDCEAVGKTSIAIKIHSSHYLVNLYALLAQTYLFIFIAAFTVIGLKIFQSLVSNKSSKPYLVLGSIVLLLYSYNFGTCLSIAIGHSLDVTRYSMYQLIYTLLPQFAGAWIIFQIVSTSIVNSLKKLIF